MDMKVNGKLLELDAEGFMLHPDDWDETVAEALAAGLGLEMNEARWEIVRLVRDHFEANHSVPELRTILKALKARHGKEKATRRYVYGLFPYGYGQQACKIAGMRKPLKLMLDV